MPDSAAWCSECNSGHWGGGAGEPIVVPMNPISMGLPLYPGAIPTQAPFAVVLGCSDARVPTEAVFDQSFNDLFVLRIAGNVLGAECLGSLHYAVRNLGDSLKLVVVLGHSKCGAVTAAVDTYLSPEAYVDIAYTYSLRSLVDQVLIAVRGAVRALEPYKSEFGDDADHYRSVLVAVAVYINAAVSAFELRREMKLRGEKGVEVVFAVYDFESLRIQCAPLPPRGRPAAARRARFASGACRLRERSDGGLHEARPRGTGLELPPDSQVLSVSKFRHAVTTFLECGDRVPQR